MSLGARFVLLGVFALVLMIVDHQQDHLRRVRALLSVAVHPINVVVDLPFSAWQGMRANMTDRATLMAENERLERELMVTDLRLQKLESLERENVRLRELLDATGAEADIDVSIAEILKVDLDNRQTFVI